MTRDQHAVLVPIVFFDCFGLPVRESELPQLVYGVALADRSLRQVLESISFVKRKNGFIYLDGHSKAINKASLSQKTALNYWQDIKRVSLKLANLPFVRMIAVINSLSLGSVDENSDIDLLIVAEPEFLFLVRYEVNLVLSMLRRRSGRLPKNKRIEIQIWVDGQGLALEHYALKNDIYFDFWANYLTPVYSEDDYYARFLAANSWLLKKFPNFRPRYNQLINIGARRTSHKGKIEGLFSKKMPFKINSFIARHQYNRLKRYEKSVSGLGAVEITKHRLRFNLTDRRQEYQKKFDRRWQEVLMLQQN